MPRATRAQPVMPSRPGRDRDRAVLRILQLCLNLLQPP